MRPEEAAAAKSKEMDDFSARDAKTMGMSTEDAANIASGGFVETVIGGDSEQPAQNLMKTYESSPSAFEDAQNLLNDYISDTKKLKKD